MSGRSCRRAAGRGHLVGMAVLVVGPWRSEGVRVEGCLFVVEGGR